MTVYSEKANQSASSHTVCIFLFLFFFLIGGIVKDPDVGRDWGQEEKGTTEDEMAGWHHRLDGHEFE